MQRPVKEVFQTFVNDTSIHGVNFIAGENRKKITRIFWTLSFILSTIYFSYNIYGIYYKWQIKPDISVRTNTKLLSEVPFPAITICTPLLIRDNLMNISDFINRLHNKRNVSEDEINYFTSGIQSCNPAEATYFQQFISNYNTDINIVKILEESSLSTTEAFAKCSHKDYDVKCSKLFNRVLTDRGFCYSFNMQGFNTIFNADVISDNFKSYNRTSIAKSANVFNKLHGETVNDDNETIKWTLDGGYSKDHDLDELPMSAQRKIEIGAYTVLNKNNAQNRCPIYGNNFNYYFHLPNEILFLRHKKEYIKFHEEKVVTLSAKSFKTDEGLKKISPEIRNCYFDNERKLKFFKSYTKSNCDFECMTNYTLMECGCVKFNMPHDSNTPICDWNKTICHYKAVEKWLSIVSIKDTKIATCGCLQTCSYVKYSIEYEEVHEITKQSEYKQYFDYSTLHFIFSNPLIDEEEIYAGYELQNFIADTGGLLGLFIGCSLLSIIEIFYFIASMIVKIFSTVFNKFNITTRVYVNENVITVRANDISHVNWVTQQQQRDNLIQMREEIDRQCYNLRFELHRMIKQRDDNIFKFLNDKFPSH